MDDDELLNPDPPTDAVDELLAEYLDAYQVGHPPDLEAFLAAHPQHADELRSLIETWHRLVEPTGAELQAAVKDLSPVNTEAAWARFQRDFLDAELEKM